MEVALVATALQTNDGKINHFLSHPFSMMAHSPYQEKHFSLFYMRIFAFHFAYLRIYMQIYFFNIVCKHRSGTLNAVEELRDFEPFNECSISIFSTQSR